ncbi:MAG TPA: helix-turn-helix domain-containing protein [Paenalcaligenes sp.]|nr:helix-turn-helix domain-containing protein [Paenalcaligenes sp.]
MSTINSLQESVRDSIERYLEDLGDAEPNDMLSMVINCVEKPVIQIALEQTQGNQTRAARMLGITRSTLRKKIITHDIKL